MGHLVACPAIDELAYLRGQRVALFRSGVHRSELQQVAAPQERLEKLSLVRERRIVRNRRKEFAGRLSPRRQLVFPFEIAAQQIGEQRAEAFVLAALGKSQ